MFRSMLAMTIVVLLGFSPDAFAQQSPKGKSNFFEFVGFSTTPIMPGPNVGLPVLNRRTKTRIGWPAAPAQTEGVS